MKPAGWMAVGAVGTVVLLGAIGITYSVARSSHPSANATSTAATTVGRSITTLTAPPTTAPPPATSPTSTTQPPTFASLYQNDVSGVVRIDATTCSGGGVGSGFLISPTLIATAAHVVDGAVVIGLSDGGHTTVGHVVGINDSTDVALVQASTPFSGHTFTLDASQPPVGTLIGVIGYPEGGPISFSQGSISGLDRTIDIGGQPRSGLIQTDAALNPGNSGGPLLLVNGNVVGVADALNTSAQGIGYAVPSTAASPLLSSWKASPVPPGAPTCSNPLGPSGFGQVGNSAAAPAGVIATLTTYFGAIDTGDYATAYAQLAPDEKATLTEAQFAANDATTFDYNVSIGAATPSSSSELVDVSFTSLQSPAEGPNGDQCDNWTLEYTMINSGGSWLIEAAKGQGGITHASCG